MHVTVTNLTHTAALAEFARIPIAAGSFWSARFVHRVHLLDACLRRYLLRLVAACPASLLVCCRALYIAVAPGSPLDGPGTARHMDAESAELVPSTAVDRVCARSRVVPFSRLLSSLWRCISSHLTNR